MCYSELLYMQEKQICTYILLLELSASCIFVNMKASCFNNFNSNNFSFKYIRDENYCLDLMSCIIH